MGIEYVFDYVDGFFGEWFLFGDVGVFVFCVLVKPALERHKDKCIKIKCYNTYMLIR